LVTNFEVAIISPKTISQAIDISILYQYRYFDSLMIACALENKCKIFYSEDMHHNHLIDNSLKIVNPYL